MKVSLAMMEYLIYECFSLLSSVVPKLRTKSIYVVHLLFGEKQSLSSEMFYQTYKYFNCHFQRIPKYNDGFTYFLISLDVWFFFTSKS